MYILREVQLVRLHRAMRFQRLSGRFNSNSIQLTTDKSYVVKIKSRTKTEREKIHDYYHHTAPESPQQWCHNEPGGCWDCGIDPGCASQESHSSSAKPHPHGTLGSQTAHWWEFGLSQHPKLLTRQPMMRLLFNCIKFNILGGLRKLIGINRTFSMLIFSGITIMQR